MLNFKHLTSFSIHDSVLTLSLNSKSKQLYFLYIGIEKAYFRPNQQNTIHSQPCKHKFITKNFVCFVNRITPKAKIQNTPIFCISAGVQAAYNTPKLLNSK